MKRTILLSVAVILVLASSDIFAQKDANTCKGDGGAVFYPERGSTVSHDALFYTIKGLVTDEHGEPLIGVSVVPPYKRDSTTIKGLLNLDRATITGLDGRFSVDVDGNELDILHFYYIGFRPMMVAVSPEYASSDIVVQITEINKEEYEKPVLVKKPVIYLYPEIKTKIQIKHTFKGDIHTTYPAYNDGWEVVAEPNGRLFNTQDNRHYNYLFWDGFYHFSSSHYNYKEGFYVDRENYTSFLLEKLSLLGLNETEINDFIVYWLPELNRYDCSFIHFRVNDDIGNSSKLEVVPQPDVMIRVFMEFEEYDGKAEKLKEQELPQLERGKFTLIEWGGTEIPAKGTE